MILPTYTDTGIIVNITNAMECDMKLPTYSATEISVKIASAWDIWMRYKIAYIYCYGNDCEHY